MSVKIKRINGPKSLMEALRKVKPVKVLDAKKHLGKVKWGENPLEYQKRIRDEWH